MFYPPDQSKKATETAVEKDFNPDHNSSVSGLYVEEKDESVLYVLKVQQLGAIVMRASCDDAGELVFDGVSTFTEAEIRGAQRG